jgi:heterodisulfide reductase subunit B
MAASKPFDIEFAELDDWNCCGATEYIALNKMAAYALVARNLVIAKNMPGNGSQLVAPCSACFLNLSKAEHYLTEDPKLAESISIAWLLEACTTPPVACKCGTCSIYSSMMSVTKQSPKR